MVRRKNKPVWAEILDVSTGAQNPLRAQNSWSTILSVSRITDLLKRRKALLAKANKHLEKGTKAFADAAKIDEELQGLAERMDELFGGSGSRVRPKLPSEPSESEIEKMYNPYASHSVIPPRKGRVPSLQEPIREVLEKNNNQPMSQDQLLAALEQNNVAVKGKKPKSTLSAHVSYLIKKDFLVRVDGERIALKQALLVPPRRTQTH